MTESRVPRRRRFVVCEPRHFAVQYAINPWMSTGRPVDVIRALDQWQALVGTYRAHGHTVDTVAPVPGLPDMVFAANCAVVVEGRVFGSLFH
ncbi:amidinotransferase, partial [Streptomyces sp. SID5926]|nr:amidinotransferase [Streptomyces sp. SID5926]